MLYRSSMQRKESETRQVLVMGGATVGRHLNTDLSVGPTSFEHKIFKKSASSAMESGYFSCVKYRYS